MWKRRGRNTTSHGNGRLALATSGVGFPGTDPSRLVTHPCKPDNLLGKSMAPADTPRTTTEHLTNFASRGCCKRSRCCSLICRHAWSQYCDVPIGIYVHACSGCACGNCGFECGFVQKQSAAAWSKCLVMRTTALDNASGPHAKTARARSKGQPAARHVCSRAPPLYTWFSRCPPGCRGHARMMATIPATGPRCRFPRQMLPTRSASLDWSKATVHQTQATLD